MTAAAGKKPQKAAAKRSASRPTPADTPVAQTPDDAALGEADSVATAPVGAGPMQTFELIMPAADRAMIGSYSTALRIIRDLKRHLITDLPVTTPAGDVIVTVAVRPTA